MVGSSPGWDLKQRLLAMNRKFGGLTRSPCGIQGFQLGFPVACGGSSDISVARHPQMGDDDVFNFGQGL